MLLANQNKPSLWGSLLWKDLQQVKLAFLVLVSLSLHLSSSSRLMCYDCCLIFYSSSVRLFLVVCFIIVHYDLI